MDPAPFYGKIAIYPSAVATFHAPSDISGVNGMCHEHIHAMKLWRKGPPCYDTIFVNINSEKGMCGLHIACAQLLFSFTHNKV